ncbi:MAG: serine hydrolase domain-containing protein [Arenicellales bacterium]|jgi:CubicO group peptidase (beta-lactamase class C family)|nr:serine hydrolase domain-containing protein [Arenicellales bacterium]|tara:strand:+ start:6672 stop:7835 length:1164 start_codon:yes stop_codon:yes gene_type:complete
MILRQVSALFLVFTVLTAWSAHSKELTCEYATQRLQAVADDVVRRGSLGTVLIVNIPGICRIPIAAGHVDRERTIPMDAARGFQIGSITKMFASASVQLLAKDGKLDLDDLVSKYVTGFAGSEQVTIRHLLTHTSGIGDGQLYVDNPRPYPKIKFTLEDFLFLSQLQGQQFEPGEGFTYNNMAFVVLSRIAEMVSGQSRVEFLRQRIFKPLGMTHTYVGEAEAWPYDLMARGYYANPESPGVFETTGPMDLSVASAAGDMISTGDDLIAWMDALGTEGNPMGLWVEDFRESPAKWKASDGADSRRMVTEYGYGIIRMSLAGHIVWGHSGNIHGYNTMAYLDPQSRITFAFLSSYDGEPSSEERSGHDVMQTAAVAALQVSLDLQNQR